MCDKDHKGLVPYTEIDRRRFLGTAVAAGAVAGIAAPAQAAPAQAGVVERDVAIRTPDGTCDAKLFLPAARSAPGALVWPDIGGLRPATADIGRRLAGQGHVALVVNPFYRSGDAAATGLDMHGFADPKVRERQMGFRKLLTDDGVDRDAVAFVAWLDALKETSNAKVGVQGYCMGGPLAFRTAAAVPGRVGAAATFHGGGLVTKDASSPHLLIPKTRARFLVAVAKNDDASQPDAKTVLKDAFAAARRPATVEVYGGDHGWCVPDNSSYDRTEAERAWAALTMLYKVALV